MAHFTRVRPLGTWLTATTVVQAEWEKFDLNLFKSLNGDDGGTWAPLAPIIIGGAGFQVTVTATIQDLEVNDTTTLNSLGVEGAAGFAAAVTIQGTGSLQCDAPATFTDTVTCSNTVDINDLGVATMACSGASFFNGAATFTDTLDADDIGTNTFQCVQTSVFQGAITLSGAGQVRWRPVLGADADTTYNVSTNDSVLIPAASLSANRIYTIGSTGADTGSRMRIVNHDVSYQVQLKRADASSICTLRSGFSGLYGWVELVWIGGRWELDTFYYHQ